MGLPCSLVGRAFWEHGEHFGRYRVTGGRQKQPAQIPLVARERAGEDGRSVKLPFPYTLAAQLMLFGPPPRKATVFHFLIWAGILLGAVGFYLAVRGALGPWVAGGLAVPAGLLVGGVIFWISSQLLDWLKLLVMKGLVQEPDMKTLDATLNPRKGHGEGCCGGKKEAVAKAGCGGAGGGCSGHDHGHEHAHGHEAQHGRA